MKKTAPFALCVWGAVLPYSQLIPWLTAHDLKARQFLLLANRIRTFFAPVVLLRFIRAESSRLRIPHAWRAIPATFLVPVSLGLPCFFILAKFNCSDRPPGQLVN